MDQVCVWVCVRISMSVDAVDLRIYGGLVL